MNYIYKAQFAEMLQIPKIKQLKYENQIIKSVKCC